jgi:arabinose-5-phosphate isomerase
LAVQKRGKKRGGRVAISFSEKQAAKKAALGRATSATASAQRTIETESAGLAALRQALGNGLAAPFARAVEVLDKATRQNPATGTPSGRVVVSGVGKSGHIGRKIAATLASTGTPSFFVHPAEASHGDLGMVTRDDVILAISWSGEAVELRALVEFASRFGNPLIALTAVAESSLARQADLVLVLPEATEACPHGLAPTTSTLMQMALGDALAIALLEARGFTAEDFHVFHPGGRLGAKFNFVGDIMHRGRTMPLARLGTTMSEAIVRITEKGLGCLGITDAGGRLVGIITDGDLRRHLGPKLLSRLVDDVMTRAPKTIAPDLLVGAALDLINQAKITALFVVEGGKPVGVVHMHDLLRIGVA